MTRTAVAARLSVLHLIHVLGETNSQYNEHCLPTRDTRDLAICPFFVPELTPPPDIAVFAGDSSVPGFFRALHRAVRSRRYDAIHAHSPQTGSMLALYLLTHPGRGLRRRTVYTVHDSFHDYKPRNKLLMVPGFVFCKRVVFCSHAAYASFPRVMRALVGKRARVVQNAADLDRVERVVARAPHPPRSRFTVLAVSRLERVKDPLVLLRAFEAGTAAPSRLTLVGTGRLGTDVAARVEQLHVEDRVELTGLIPRDEVFARCTQADVFVSVSRGEGLPVAVMEAMAAGLPVILSDIPPHRELVGDATFVPLVAPGDVAGFAREIRRFQDMPAEARARVGALCRTHVRDRFTIARMQAGYDAVYRELGRHEAEVAA
jgi:glycosyltransferase involved in cell wall biosynthesis